MGDWRLAKVGRIAGDQTLPGGARAKDGDLLWQITVTKDPKAGLVNFPTPSPVALALSLAVQAALAATAARRSIKYPRRMLDGSHTAEGAEAAPLYEFFEQSMVAVTFSFQSIEAYANEVINDRLTGPLTLKRKKGTVTLTPEELERTLSTEEKVATVLPLATGVKSPKGTRVWQRFMELKGVRDSTVHLKSADQYVRGRLDRESLYYRLLNSEPSSFPRTAFAAMRHFMGSNVMRWVLAAESRLAETSR